MTCAIDVQRSSAEKFFNANKRKQIIRRRNKKQLGKIKDNKIKTRLDLLTRRGNIKNNKNNKNNNIKNNNNNNFLLDTPLNIPPGFPPELPFDRPSPPDFPTFSPHPPYSLLFPPFPSTQLMVSVPRFFVPPARVMPSAPSFPDYDTTFTEKAALADSTQRTTQR